MLAAVGNQGVGLILALLECLQVGQDLLQVRDFPAEPDEVALCRRLGLRRFLQARFLLLELLLVLRELGSLERSRSLQSLLLSTLFVQFLACRLKLIAHRVGFSLQTLLLGEQSMVESITLLFPLGLPRLVLLAAIGVTSGVGVFSLILCHDLGTLIHHQQKEDQRPHRA